MTAQTCATASEFTTKYKHNDVDDYAPNTNNNNDYDDADEDDDANNAYDSANKNLKNKGLEEGPFHLSRQIRQNTRGPCDVVVSSEENSIENVKITFKVCAHD